MTTGTMPKSGNTTAFKVRLRRADRLLTYARRHRGEGFEWAARGCIRDMRISGLYQDWFNGTTFEQRDAHPQYRRLRGRMVYDIGDWAQHGDLDRAIEYAEQLLDVIRASADYVSVAHSVQR